MSGESNRSSGYSKWLMIGALVVAVLMGLGRLGAGLIDLSGAGDGPDCSDAVAWDEAVNHTGEYITVRGPVVDTNYAQGANGQPTFLNIGRSHPDPNRFTVVIWGDARPQFERPPEVVYLGHEVCVSGEAQMYEGSPQIELDGPGAITTAD